MVARDVGSRSVGMANGRDRIRRIAMCVQSWGWLI